MVSHRHRIWLTALATACLAACSGKVVVDQGGGGATSTTMGGGGLGGAGGVGGAGGCDGLWASFDAQRAAAQACNPAINAIQCSGAVVTTDGCGCTVVANDQSAAAAQSANAAFEAWVAAGCGPYECFACPAPPPSVWYCDPTTSQCQPEWKD